MNMDRAQIAGKDYRLPPPGAGPAAIMSDKDAEVLRETNPELLAAMGTLTNEQRTEVLDMVRAIAGLEEKSEQPVQPKRKGRAWSPEERAAASVKAKAGYAERQSAKAREQVFTGE